MSQRALTALLLAAAVTGCATSAPHTSHTPARDPKAAWEKSLARPPLAVGATFDARGRLWLVRVVNGRLQVSYSQDAGRNFSQPVIVNTEPERIAADGENRPKLAFGGGNEIYVSWTQSLDAPFSGHVRFSRSLDDGRSFSAPVTVNDNREIISHRFDNLLVDGKGRVWLVWLDKRDQSAAKRRGENYAGAALYAAVSGDRGETFSANRKLADHSCECCRIALARDTDGTPVALWRHIFGANLRDHALARLDGEVKLRRVGEENWAIDACPHHGPALAVASDGVHHATWYSGAPERNGLYYAHSTGRGESFSVPVAFGNNDAQASHPAVLAQGREVTLAWKEFDGEHNLVRLMRSRDGGGHWDAPRTAGRTRGAADSPQLLGDGRGAWLLWNTADEGAQVIGVAQP